ncbi:DUF1559 family PulG-like putative transporter [Planctomicrobium piriforme]|uniref:DUF1559 domain-containing protein n=1 Tax=Planctomicrobium piriforme TaxID=1576369 RepID=A0A1I3IBA6_9PLAN|nr:DUF1559 domain-containing protein [Planctomicrobium piriforme]SFI45221.1 Protein of unknown function [Planctomicrobium piriforme]
MTSPQNKVLHYVIYGMLGLLLLACAGVTFVHMTLFRLVIGWIFFARDVFPQVQVSIPGVLTAGFCLAMFIAGLHLICQRVSIRYSQSKWPLRWTFSISGIVILMFVAGTSAVAILHQGTWLFGGDAPILRNSFREYFDANESKKHLKQMGLAIHNRAEQADGQLPQGGLFDQDGRGLHSWETQILPFLDQPDLAAKIDLKIPWTDAAQSELFRKELPVFLRPGVKVEPVDGFAPSHYAINSHLMSLEKPLRLQDVKDGLSNTLFIGEVDTNPRAWGDPVNWRDPSLGLRPSPLTFSSPDLHSMKSYSAGVLFLLGNGSAHRISKDIDPAVLKVLSTPNGGEQIPAEF